jgi:hypothetical protein
MREEEQAYKSCHTTRLPCERGQAPGQTGECPGCENYRQEPETYEAKRTSSKGNLMHQLAVLEALVPSQTC